jgi:hypothetical protein
MNFYLIFLILLIIYASLYYIIPSSLIILQTTLNNFNFDLLLEKQPLIIQDKIADVNQVISSWFKENIIEDINNTKNDDWITNKHKYLYIQSDDETEIEIIIQRNNSNVVIKLKNKQNIILPFMCKYYINNPKIIIKGIHDYITYFLAFFF